MVSLTTTFMAAAEHQRLAEAKARSEQGWLVTARSDLPTLSDDEKVEVVYAETSLGGTATQLLQLAHAGLVFRRLGATSSRVGTAEPGALTAAGWKEVFAAGPSEAPTAFTLQYFGVNFGRDVVMPRVTQRMVTDEKNNTTSSPPLHTSLEWRNDSIVVFTPHDHPADWSVGLHRVGTVSGLVFNKYAEWAAGFTERHPGYDLFDLVPRIGTASWHAGLKCSEFANMSLVQLHSLGAEFRSEVQLFTNHAPLVVAAPPKLVNMADEGEVAGLVEHFMQLDALANEFGGEQGAEGRAEESERMPAPADGEEPVILPAAPRRQTVTLPAALRAVAAKLERWYVFDRRDGTYWRADLVEPYVRMDRIYAPVELPWQRPAALDSNHAGGGSQEVGAAALLTGAVTGVVRTVTERLPRLCAGEARRSAVRAGAVALLALVLGVPAWLLGSTGDAARLGIKEPGPVAAFWTLGVLTGCVLAPSVAAAYFLK